MKKRNWFLLPNLVLVLGLLLTACAAPEQALVAPEMEPPENNAAYLAEAGESSEPLGIVDNTEAVAQESATDIVDESSSIADVQPAGSTLPLEIPGNRGGWLNTGIWLESGDEFEIQAGGTINIWPNCEETKVGAGFPDLDCTLVTQVTPDGVTVFGMAGSGYPYPDGPIAALAGRLGDQPAFMVGTGGAFTAESNGLLQFAINDIESLDDNQGAFNMLVTIPYSVPEIIVGDWITTGIHLEVGEAFTITAAGEIDMWPNCEATKAEQGYSDLDCSLVHAVGPAGVELFAPGLPDYPLPKVNTMALVGRVGNGPVFLIGEGGNFVAEQGGPLLVMTNDTPYWKQDDIGIFALTVYRPIRQVDSVMQLEVR